jgi:transposase
VTGGSGLHPLGTGGRVGAPLEPRSGVRGRARHGVPRRHERAGAPEGRRSPAKRGSHAERDDREALGRSRGRHGTKACVIADASGRAIAFRIAPGQAHELPPAIPLLEQRTGVPKGALVSEAAPATAAVSPSGARGRGLRSRRSGMRRPWPARSRSMPSARSGRAPLGEAQGVESGRPRYEKTASSFTGVLCLAATRNWCKR